MVDICCVQCVCVVVCVRGIYCVQCVCVVVCIVFVLLKFGYLFVSSLIEDNRNLEESWSSKFALSRVTQDTYARIIYYNYPVLEKKKRGPKLSFFLSFLNCCWS